MIGAVWGPLMFLGALAFIFTGYPVAFALAGTALLFAVLGSLFGHFDLILLTALPERTFGTMSEHRVPRRSVGQRIQRLGRREMGVR